MSFFRNFVRRLALLVCLLASAGASSLPLSSAAWAQSAPSLTVVIEGNRRIDTETIRKYFKNVTDDDSANEAVRQMNATGLFSKVSVRRQGSSLIVTVAENGVINRVAFEGNSKVKGDTLQEQILSKSRGPYSPEMVKGDVQRLRDFYQSSGGRGGAEVSSRIVDLPNGSVDVVFTIKEGEKTGVKTIDFSGNRVFSSNKLRGLMKTTEMNFLSWMKTSDVYDPNRIGSDQETIRRFYLKNGYADFQITRSDVEFDAKKGGYTILMSVDEGPQYKLSNVSVESHISGADTTGLRELVNLRPGSVYDGLQVEQASERLTKEMSRRGYPFVQVRTRQDRGEGNTLSVAFIIEEGSRVYIEKINITGNTRTREYVIRRELDINEGDAYNKALLDKAERRLYGLGFFKSVRITLQPGSVSDRVVVSVAVEDQNTGTAGLSGGYSSMEKFSVSASVSESNFMGQGQYAKLSVMKGQISQGVDFSFTDPYFLGQRMSAGVDLFYKQVNQNIYALYSTESVGGTFRIGLPVTETVTFQPSYSLFSTKISLPDSAQGCLPGSLIYNNQPVSETNNCLNSGASLAVLEASKLNNQITSMASYAVAYNTLDNPSNPTSGIHALFKQDYAGLGGDKNYLRTTGDLKYYHEVYDGIVGIARLQGGKLYGFGDTPLQITDNFNPGSSLVRGFAPMGIGPRDISNPLNSQQSSLGGTTYYGASLELQFPIFGLPKDLGLRGAVFADAGTVYGYTGQTNFTALSPGNNGVQTTCPATVPQYTLSPCLNVADSSALRGSVGVSLLWASPLGPLRFDWAKAINQQTGDQTQVFSFSGGTSF